MEPAKNEVSALRAGAQVPPQDNAGGSESAGKMFLIKSSTFPLHPQGVSTAMFERLLSFRAGPVAVFGSYIRERVRRGNRKM